MSVRLEERGARLAVLSEGFLSAASYASFLSAMLAVALVSASLPSSVFFNQRALVQYLLTGCVCHLSWLR